MFKLMFFFFKVTFFTAFILILSHVIEWNGKTVSDQVKNQMASVERTTEWIGDVKDRAVKWVGDLGDQTSTETPKPRKKMAEKKSLPVQNEFTPTERQKLRALIQELNENVAQ